MFWIQTRPCPSWKPPWRPAQVPGEQVASFTIEKGVPLGAFVSTLLRGLLPVPSRSSTPSRPRLPSTEVPPAPPGWLEAVKAVANIPFNGDPMVADILGRIRESLVEAQERALGEYRESTKLRHQRLAAMMSQWRAV